LNLASNSTGSKFGNMSSFSSGSAFASGYTFPKYYLSVSIKASAQSTCKWMKLFLEAKF